MQDAIYRDIDQAKSFILRGEGLSVNVTDFGARLMSFCYEGADMLVGPKSPDELKADTCYCGSICGRVANRIAGGEFALDGVSYRLPTNNGPNHLHGGMRGFDARLWETLRADEQRVDLRLHSPAGAEGYPGALEVYASYYVCGHELHLEMRAESDAPTLINLTNHAYWNLSGSACVDDHSLQVAADAYTPMVANIPTGAIDTVEGTLYDLREPALLGERYAALGAGYDDNYVLRGEGLRLAAVLSDGRHRLSVYTDAPGMQVYTGDYLPHPRQGVALEAQSFPDTPHHAHFPSIVLRPGQTYTRHIFWDIARA